MFYKKNGRASRNVIGDVKKYYLKDDLVFHFDVHEDEYKDILHKLLKILNSDDKDQALKCYLELLTFYGEDSLKYILKNTKLKSSGKTLKQSIEYQKFLDFLKTRNITPYDAIIGLSPMYPKKERNRAAIYSKDYIIEDNEKGIFSAVSFGYPSRGLDPVYQEINHGIIYNQVDLLKKHIDFIAQRKCYFFLFQEYPELKSYIQKEERPTNPYIRKRVNK